MMDYRKLLIRAYRSHLVLFLILTTMGGCGSALVEHPCFLISPDEIVLFLVESGEPGISRNVEFMEGLGRLSLCAEGHLDGDGNYVLSMYIETYGDDLKENLRFEPHNVRASAGDAEMEVASTREWGKEFNTDSWLIDLRCSASHLKEITSEDTENPHIVIVIDLSSYIFIDDDAVGVEPIRAVQKVPIPQYK